MEEQIPDNTLHFKVYLNQDLDRLCYSPERALVSLRALIADLCSGYIWQYEEPSLSLSMKDVPHITGDLFYGDSVEDEWLTVYLLKQFSVKHQDVWIEAVDSDGQFQLIEGSAYLPPWLQPEVANHRIWIHSGQLKYIQDGAAKMSLRSLELQEALDILEREPSRVVHDKTLETAAWHRLEVYPQQILRNLHHFTATIPRKLAIVLFSSPQSISAAISAFITRDQISMRPLMRKHVDPHANVGPLTDETEGYQLVFPPRDMVNVSILFNKLGYAQVRSQDFATPAAWQGKLPLRSAPNYDRAQMGMRVTVGFEASLADPVARKRHQVRQIIDVLRRYEHGELRVPSNDEIEIRKVPDDSEAWMSVDLDEIKAEKRRRKGESEESRPGLSGTSGDDTNGEKTVRDMMAQMRAFMGAEAAYDGADDSLEDWKSDDESDLDADAWRRLDSEMDDAQFDETMRDMMNLSPDDIIQRNKTLGLEDIVAGHVRSLPAEPVSSQVKPPASDLPVYGPSRPPGMLPFPERPRTSCSPHHVALSAESKIMTKKSKVPLRVIQNDGPSKAEDLDEDGSLSENEVMTDLVDRFGAELAKMGAMGLEDPDMKAALKKASRVQRYRDKPASRSSEVASSGSETEDGPPKSRPGQRRGLQKGDLLETAPNPSFLNERFSAASTQMRNRLADNAEKIRHAASAPPSRVVELDNSDDESEPLDDEEIDAQTVRNMLESFKAQGAASGPAGNLLGMMGIQLPRDEDSD